MNSVLERDNKLLFPSVVVLNASAGSGKTHNLTLRLLQFLLSNTIPHNELRNILAVTFTNNAVREMRERVLGELKKIVLGDRLSLSSILSLVESDASSVRKRAGYLLETILTDFEDLQIKTIDSFLVGLFRSAALSFGFSPDVKILLGDYRLVDTAFDLYFRDRILDDRGRDEIEELVELARDNRRTNQSFVWDPYRHLSREMKRLTRGLAVELREPSVRDYSTNIESLKGEIKRQFEHIIAAAGKWERAKNFESAYELARRGDVLGLFSRVPFTKVLKKPRNSNDLQLFAPVEDRLARECVRLNDLIGEFARLYAVQFYLPYVRASGLVARTLDDVKREENALFIEDISKLLVSRINREMIPDIYLRLGEVVYHFLIDEFQDTSPIQWTNIFPLAENALATEGSLFIVGDTKQSIFGFRGADWRIMQSLEAATVFPSASHQVRPLEENFRSGSVILEFVRSLFQQTIATQKPEAVKESGLDAFVQRPRPELDDRGAVTVNVVDAGQELDPEKGILLKTLDSLWARGYRNRDVAIITPENDNVVHISAWLNARSIPFVSHSSLDVRKRKVVGELLALLHFLDSPVDYLSFATVVLGDVFGKWCEEAGAAVPAGDIREFVSRNKPDANSPLYKKFQGEYPSLWRDAFDDLLTIVGYLPPYDLVCDILKTFKVFRTIPQEEASFAKFAEVVRLFEAEGRNNLKEFLEFADEDADSGRWNIDIPDAIDAVNVMTVHKAKGLGYPVVIAVLYDVNLAMRNMVMAEEGGRTTLLRIREDLCKWHPELQAIRDGERMKAEVDALNKLYVCLTRAKEELHIVSVYRKTRREPSVFFPPGGEVYGTPSTKEQPPVVEESYSPLDHQEARSRTLVASAGRLASSEITRGEIVHAVLSGIQTVEHAPAIQCDIAIAGMSGHWHPTLLEAARKSVIRFLSDPAASPWFGSIEGRTVLTEYDFVSNKGMLYRMDRVVVDLDTVSILDFKTGGDEQERKYCEQVERYCQIARECFPGKAIHGYLAYVDKCEIRKVT